MNISFEKLTLTTDHPSSSYNLGVVIDQFGKVYMPSDFFECPPGLQVVLGVEGRSMAAQIVAAVKSVAYSLSEEEIEQVKRYLSQHPNPADNELL